MNGGIKRVISFLSKPMSQLLANSITLRPSLFWDVNPADLSVKKNKDFIIRRVFDRGTWDEILNMVVYYGEETVEVSLLKAPALRKATVYLASAFFNKKPEDFACYNTNLFQVS
jgi:hypothetical protein